MIEFDPNAQPRFIKLLDSSDQNRGYINKLLEDPDFISMDLEQENQFELRWAADDTVFSHIDDILDSIQSIDGPSTISKGAIPYKKDGKGREKASALEDRLINCSILNKTSSLHVVSSIESSPFHETPTHEVWLTLKRNDTAARYITRLCVAMTAREELSENVDMILDEFAEYLPVLSR